MKEITLINSDKVTLVDDGDYEEVSKYRWCLTPQGYARNTLRRKHNIFMHRLILKSPKGIGTDHINRNTLDNRRENLRFATQSQNNMNSLKHRDALTSRFKGVSWQKAREKWMAVIGIDGKYIFLGRFNSEEQAARAYDRAALKHFGEFARVNF